MFVAFNNIVINLFSALKIAGVGITLLALLFLLLEFLRETFDKSYQARWYDIGKNMVIVGILLFGGNIIAEKIVQLISSAF